MREKKIAAVQGTVGDDATISLKLLSNMFIDQAKDIARDVSSDLTFVGVENAGAQPILTWRFSESVATKIENEAIEQAVETLRNRVDQFGVAEPLIQTSG